LGKVEVEGGSDEQLKTFYSCLHRTVCFPQNNMRLILGEIVHYSPTSKVLPGYMYAELFWDTFRALYPLLNLSFDQ
jgi:putative alpha-1,2-mannosidase